MFSIQSNRDFLVLLNPLRRRHSLHLAECGEEGCLLEATLFAEGCHGELLVQSLRHKTLELLKAIGIDIVVIWFLDMKREDLAQLACRHSKGRGDVTHLQLLVEIRLCLAHILVHTEEETLHLLFVYSGLLIFRFLGHGLLLLHRAYDILGSHGAKSSTENIYWAIFSSSISLINARESIYTMN